MCKQFLSELYLSQYSYYNIYINFNSLMIISNKTLYDRIIYHFIVKM